MSYNRKPWTFNQLEEIIPKIENKLDEIEGNHEEEINPLPPMTTQECLNYFLRIIDVSKQRILSKREAFILEQLLANYKMAVMAELLCKSGRYFVISENDTIEMLNYGNKVH